MPTLYAVCDYALETNESDEVTGTDTVGFEFWGTFVEALHCRTLRDALKYPETAFDHVLLIVKVEVPDGLDQEQTTEFLDEVEWDSSWAHPAARVMWASAGAVRWANYQRSRGKSEYVPTGL